jgi:hypothetical protein
MDNTAYQQSYKQLEHIRQTSNEMVFRMAISHLMDCGYKQLSDEETIRNACAEIMKEDDRHSIMTNQFKCDILLTAGKLAQIKPIHLLVYISQNVEYDVGANNSIGYGRLYQMLRDLMEWTVADSSDSSEDYDTFSDFLNFSDEELEELGFGYLLDLQEKE